MLNMVCNVLIDFDLNCLSKAADVLLTLLSSLFPTLIADVQMLSGFKNVMFGGEGLFITTLTGPGTVWLQGQPPQRMVSESKLLLDDAFLSFLIVSYLHPSFT
jgi:hypothetical protein